MRNEPVATVFGRCGDAAAMGAEGSGESKGLFKAPPLSNEQRPNGRMPMTGKEMVAAWKRWLASNAGKQCAAGSADGQYLENRLNTAFYAGIEAAEQLWKDVPIDRLKTL